MRGFNPSTAQQSKARKSASSGPVRGPGSGTSDDVPAKVRDGTYIMPTDSTQAIGEEQLEGLGKKQLPVNLSNGEFKLPPEQVHAVGVQALDQMKDATHTPVNADAAKGFKPELYFANGGLADDETQQAAVIPPAPAPAAQPPAAAPMDWAARNDQRNTQVTASSIVASPERDAAQAALRPPPTTPAAPAAGIAPAAPMGAASGVGGMSDWQTRLDQRNTETTASSIVPSAGRTAALSALGVQEEAAKAKQAAPAAPPPSPPPPPEPAAVPSGPTPGMQKRPISAFGLPPPIRGFAGGGPVYDQRRPGEPVVGTRSPLPSGGGGGLSAEAVAAAQARPMPPAQQPRQGVAGLVANPVTNPEAITRERERKAMSVAGFAAGGVASEEEVKRKLAEQANARQSAMYVVGAEAAAAARPAPAAVPPAAPVTPSAEPAKGFSYADNNKAAGDRAKESWGQGQYGQAAGQLARGTVGMLTTPWIDGAVQAGSSAWEGAKGFGRGLFGIEQSAAAGAPAAAAPAGRIDQTATPAISAAAAKPVAAAKLPVESTPTPSAAVNAVPGTTVKNPVVETPTQQVAPGVYRQGNSYSDSPRGFESPNTGQPSQKNMDAAQALSDRYQQQAMAPRGFSPADDRVPNLQVPSVTHSGNDWASRKALENAQTAASSITQNGGRFDARRTHTAQVLGDSKEMLAYNAMRTNDLALQAAEPQMAQAAMRESGANGRAAEQQQGENYRAGIREQGDSARSGARNALDNRRMAMDEKARGFDYRQAERTQALQDKYDNAKTPEDRAAVAKQIRDLSGKGEPADWGIQVTPATKNADGSTTEGSIVRFNKATGQAERVDVGQGAQPKPQPKTAAEAVAGQVYQTARGPMRWNGKQFVAL